MKADEVLRLYKQGKRDFRGADLRGQVFKEECLDGVDFRFARLQGASFYGCSLQQTRFEEAECGWQSRIVVLPLIVIIVLAIFGSLFPALVGTLGALSLKLEILQKYGLIPPAMYFFITIGFLGILVTQGLSMKSTKSYVVWVVIIALAGFILASVFDSGSSVDSVTLFGAGVVAIALPMILVGAGIFTGSLAITLALALTINLVVAFLGFAAVNIAVAVVITFFGKGAFVVAGFGAMLMLCINFYVARRALVGDDIQSFIRGIALSFASVSGTNFRKADLTDANFTAATLKNTNFQEAILIRTCFQKATELEYVYAEKTYLESYQLCQLVVGNIDAKGKDFSDRNLQGINLSGQDLSGANFTRTNLSKADFQGTNLSHAILKQSQLDETNLTGAVLTGACIEDWNITGKTKLEGIQCKFVYMHAATEKAPNQLRKPDNTHEEFENGSFGDFIRPFVDTLDLYHTQGIDPRAIAIALNNLRNKYPGEVENIASVENRGLGFLIRINTSEGADLSKLSKNYFEEYNELRALQESDKKLLFEKDKYIRSLEEMIKTAMSSPKTIILEGAITMKKTYNFNSPIEADAVFIGDNNKNTFLHSNGEGNINFEDLSEELTKLRQHMAEQEVPDEYVVEVNAITQAEAAAKKGDSVTFGKKLSKMGAWALEVAKQVGTPILTDLLKHQLGIDK